MAATPLDDTSTGEAEAAVLAELLAEAFAFDWRGGVRGGADELIEAHPEVAARPESALRLIYEEIVLRRESGEEPDEAELIARFPRWRGELAMLLACDRLIPPEGEANATRTWPGPRPRAWPEVGDRLGGFRLLEQLGSGSVGRTFLASDPDLADRPVVLKLTPRGLAEHVSLAMLQHTHVVPLHAAPEFPEQDLRALCMPYLGGATLDRVFDDLRGRPGARPTGRSIVEAVDRARAGSAVPIRSEGPARRLLATLSYPEAIAWVASCLADALHAAHLRGMLHMDVKPANVLIAADGTPMLLDFHLARPPIDPDGPPPLSIGGTPSTMAPEQREAMEAVRAGRHVPRAVDGRADLYALGRLMDEALAVPGAAEGVSPGLRSIVDRCLAADPAGRYPDASALNDDLRRHLNDLPLRGVADRSPAERWAKWRRRNPHALSRSALVASALAGLLGLGVTGRLKHGKAVQALEVARDDLGRRLYDRALTSAVEGLASSRYWPFDAALRRSLVDARMEALRGRSRRDLHALVDRLRFVAEGDPPASRLATLRALAPKLRAAWSEYSSIGFVAPSSDDLADRRWADDLRDLALLGSELSVKLAADAPGRDRARREALTALDDAEELLGPSLALALARRSQARALGLDDLARRAASEAEARRPSTPGEFHDVGLGRLRAGDKAGAIDAFSRAVDLDPAGFWPLYHRGVAAFGLGRFDEARADFHACVALAPESAECRYDRALALEALGQHDRALDDLGRAQTLDPGFAEAPLHAGLIRYRLGRLDEAEADLRRALARGIDPAVAHYNLALVCLARGDKSAAVGHLRDAPGLEPARRLLDQLRTGG